MGRPEYLRQCVEMSLRRLKVERLDLWQFHRIDPKVPVEESLGAIKELQKQGKIRHVGLSEVVPDEIEQAKKTVPIVSVQNKYNIGDRKLRDTLEYCEKHKLGFIPWFPVAAGRSPSRAVRWMRRRSDTCDGGTVIAGVAAASLAGYAADSRDLFRRAS